jgi:hypothetical protein
MNNDPHEPPADKPVSRRRRSTIMEIDAKNAQHLYEIIDWRRRQLGISMRGLAKHSGIVYDHLHWYLRGIRELRSSHVDALLYALGLRLTIEDGFEFHRRPPVTRRPRNVSEKPMLNDGQSGEQGTGEDEVDTGGAV